MADNKQKKVSTPFEKMMTCIITLVILAVLALAVYATYGKISSNMEKAAIEAENTAIANGEQEANVRYLAEQSGMSVEDYLAQYGLTVGEDLNEDTVTSDMLDKMTLENYVKYSDAQSGSEEATSVDDLLNEWKADEVGITKDSIWGDILNTLTLERYFGDGGYDEIISQYASAGYDMSEINRDMTVTAFNDKIQEIISAGPKYTPAPTAEAAE